MGERVLSAVEDVDNHVPRDRAAWDLILVYEKYEYLENISDGLVEPIHHSTEDRLP